MARFNTLRFALFSIMVLVASAIRGQSLPIKASHFTFIVPQDMVLDTNLNVGSSMILLFPKAIYGTDGFNENINLRTVPMHDFNLDLLVDPFKQQFASEVERFKYLGDAKRTVQTGDVLSMEYTGRMNQRDLHWKQYFWCANDLLYVFTLTGEDVQWGTVLPVFDEMMRTAQSSK